MAQDAWLLHHGKDKTLMKHNWGFLEALDKVPEREIFIDNLLVRVHWIIKMIIVQRPCAMGV